MAHHGPVPRSHGPRRLLACPARPVAQPDEQAPKQRQASESSFGVLVELPSLGKLRLEPSQRRGVHLRLGGAAGGGQGRAPCSLGARCPCQRLSCPRLVGSLAGGLLRGPDPALLLRSLLRRGEEGRGGPGRGQRVLPAGAGQRGLERLGGGPGARRLNLRHGEGQPAVFGLVAHAPEPGVSLRRSLPRLRRRGLVLGVAKLHQNAGVRLLGLLLDPVPLVSGVACPVAAACGGGSGLRWRGRPGSGLQAVAPLLREPHGTFPLAPQPNHLLLEREPQLALLLQLPPEELRLGRRLLPPEVNDRVGHGLPLPRARHAAPAGAARA